jgi:hypothetical protein
MLFGGHVDPRGPINDQEELVAWLASAARGGHATDSGLPGAPEHSAHRPVHGASAESLQGPLVLTPPRRTAPTVRLLAVRQLHRSSVHADPPWTGTPWRSVRAWDKFPVGDEIGELVQDEPGIRDRRRIPGMTRKRKPIRGLQPQASPKRTMENPDVPPLRSPSRRHDRHASLTRDHGSRGRCRPQAPASAA